MLHSISNTNQLGEGHLDIRNPEGLFPHRRSECPYLSSSIRFYLPNCCHSCGKYLDKHETTPPSFCMRHYLVSGCSCSSVQCMSACKLSPRYGRRVFCLMRSLGSSVLICLPKCQNVWLSPSLALWWIIFWHWRPRAAYSQSRRRFDCIWSLFALWLWQATCSAAGMTECPDTRRWTSRRPLTTRNAQFCDGHCGMLELDPALLANPEMLE